MSLKNKKPKLEDRRQATSCQLIGAALDLNSHRVSNKLDFLISQLTAAILPITGRISVRLCRFHPRRV